MKSKTLSLRPDYNLMIIRDVDPPENREAADEAATRSGTEIAAASNEAVFISAAQRTIPVRLSVKAYSRPKGPESKSEWEGSLNFEIDFPSGAVHFGDMSHRADSMDLPGGPGRYAVTVYYAGREAADSAVREVFNLQDPEEQDRQIERRAGIESYLVVLAPSVSADRQS